MSEIRQSDKLTLEAVYNINKHAKKYARLADENYQRGKKTTAHANSLKKEALYGAKSRAINRFLLDGEDSCVCIERHQINGKSFLCLDFEDRDGDRWSFHQPEDQVLADRLPEGMAIIERDSEEFEEFESGEKKVRSGFSLKASLLHLEACGINANEYLEERSVQYGALPRFSGWPYLGDGGVRLDASDSGGE